MRFTTSRKIQCTALGSALVSALSTMPATAQDSSVETDVKTNANMEELLVTGKSESLLKARSFTAGKMDLSFKETGRSVTQLSAQQLKDLAITDVRQAFDYVAGFRGNGPADRTYTARGVRTSIDNVMVDGLRSLQGGEGGTGSRLPSTFNAESTTFLRGPAGLLYGSGVGGGMVNITSKKPQEENSTTLGLNTRSYLTDGSNFDANSIGLDLDSTGELFNDNLLYRVIAQHTPDGEHFQEGRDITESLVDAALTFKLGKNTRITPRVEITDRDRTGGSGYADGVFESNFASGSVTTYGKPINRSSYYGSPNDKGENYSRSFSLDAQHQLSDDWQLRLRARKNETESEALDLYISDSSGLGNAVGKDSVNRKWVFSKGDDEYTLFDASLEGKFNTGSIKHHFVLGANYRDMDVKFERNFQNTDDAVGLNTISASNPAQQLVGPIPTSLLEVNFSPRNEKDTNVYLKDRISIGKTTLVAGLSYVKQEQTEVRSGKTYNGDFSDTLWDLGVIQEVTDDINIFATYSRSYDPVSSRHISQYGIPGQSYVPVEGKNYELGIKGDFLDRRLSTGVTAFRLSKMNSTKFVRASGVWTIEQLSGDSFRSEGLEWDASFALTQQLRTSISYAFTRAYDTIGEDQGRQASNTPKHSVASWTNYRFDGHLSDFRLGMGLRYEGDRYDGDYVLESYFEADAGVYFESKAFDASLVLRNVFDKNRAEAGANWVTVQPNEPRSLNLSVQYRL